MKNLPDAELLSKLKTEQNAGFEHLYKAFFPSIAAYVQQNQGSKADAEDVFQETMLVLLKKIREPDFQLSAALKTYFYAIAKNIWLKRLRDNRLVSVDDYASLEQGEAAPEMEMTPEKTTEEKVTNWLLSITQHCQRILKAIFFYQEPMQSLMTKMGWKNKHVAANQQYKCIQQIKSKSDVNRV